MRARQAKKIVRIVRYTPIGRMSDKWFSRALKWAEDVRLQPRIQEADHYYWNGVVEGLVKPYRQKHTRNKYIV